MSEVPLYDPARWHQAFSPLFSCVVSWTVGKSFQILTSGSVGVPRRGSFKILNAKPQKLPAGAAGGFRRPGEIYFCDLPPLKRPSFGPGHFLKKLDIRFCGSAEEVLVAVREVLGPPDF